MKYRVEDVYADGYSERFHNPEKVVHELPPTELKQKVVRVITRDGRHFLEHDRGRAMARVRQLQAQGVKIARVYDERNECQVVI